MNKLSLTLLVSVLCVLPAAAQSQRSSAQPPARHCELCGRVETETNALAPCLLDPDVSCVFVEDKKTKGSSQKTPANTALGTQVERTVFQATMKQTNSNGTSSAQTDDQEEPLSLAELIAAEEELMIIRNRDIYATFEKYPYLLDPAYRRKGKHAEEPANYTHSKQNSPLSSQELLDAEEELSKIRSTIDPNATFEAYPYLLDSTYRRASEATKQTIRRPYLQKDWARKVGI